MAILSNTKDCPSCGSSHKTKPFCIYADGYHCFSCGVTKRGDRSFGRTPSYPGTSPELSGIPGEYETDFNRFSIASKLWLSKYYITQQHVFKYNVFETIENGEPWLIFPTVEDGNVVFYQKRCMTKRAFSSSGPKKHVYSQEHVSEGAITLVEDFVSYVRLSEHIDVVCLYGTQMTSEEASYIVQYYDTIYIWLDNDHKKDTNSGQIAAKKICKNLEYALVCYNKKRSFNTRVLDIKNIATEYDPKCYSDTEIINILEKYNG